MRCGRSCTIQNISEELSAQNIGVDKVGLAIVAKTAFDLKPSLRISAPARVTTTTQLAIFRLSLRCGSLPYGDRTSCLPQSWNC